MNEDLKRLAVVGFLLWLFWRKEETGVTIYQNCILPDGTVVRVPLGEPCPPGGIISGT